MKHPSRSPEYGRYRRRMQAYDRWEPYVDAQPARDHVQALRAVGVGPVRIAALAGVPHGSLAKLIYGDPRRGLAPSKRVRRETEACILAVDIDQHAAIVSATGTRRRLQALAVMGYPIAWISPRIGIGTSQTWRLQHGRIDTCKATTRDAVKTLYREHIMTPHDSPRGEVTRRNARQQHGWAGPLEWDNPDAEDEYAARGVSRPGPERKAS